MSHELTNSLQNSLGVYYILCALLNVGFAIYFLRRKDLVKGVVWTVVAFVFLIHAGAYMSHLGWTLSRSFRDYVDSIVTGPRGATIYVSTSFIAFAILLVFRKFFVNPQVAWAGLNLSLLLGGWAMTDPNFRLIVSKEDNVPITMLIFSVGFFTWLALYRAVQNDERLAKGLPVLEKLDDEKVLVWPDLVYTELICMIIATVALTVWAILLKAPLEQPATSAKAPNPSKAPWYFLGLQEMLVYFDPWMAGVVLPTLIIVGLVAMPYIDFNQKGNGYFSFANRAFAVTTFMFGFLVLWVVLIVLGTFLRGPNWNFFGPFEFWDTHKVDPLNNINVSDIFWLHWLGRPLEGMNPVVRELPGLVLVLFYLFAVPPILAATVFRSFFIKMGFVRYMTLMVLILFMAALPIKMVLRWTLNLKYIVYIPEIFFNI
jgi:Cytochrome b(C-terminal)/b6/petD